MFFSPQVLHSAGASHISLWTATIQKCDCEWTCPGKAGALPCTMMSSSSSLFLEHFLVGSNHSLYMFLFHKLQFKSNEKWSYLINNFEETKPHNKQDLSQIHIISKWQTWGTGPSLLTPKPARSPLHQFCQRKALLPRAKG